MSIKLLTEHLLEVLSLKGGCTGSSESTLVKMSNCWAQILLALNSKLFLFASSSISFGSSKEVSHSLPTTYVLAEN